MKIIENNTREPKNILEKVTTQLLSLFNIAFLEIVFSTAQRKVAARTKKSPVLISAEIFCICIRTSPSSMIPIAINCCFVIFSLRNMNARTSAYIGRVLCRNAARTPNVILSPAKKSQKANPPPIIPISRRFFHEVCLKFFCFFVFCK